MKKSVGSTTMVQAKKKAVQGWDPPAACIMAKASNIKTATVKINFTINTVTAHWGLEHLLLLRKISPVDTASYISPALSISAQQSIWHNSTSDSTIYKVLKP